MCSDEKKPPVVVHSEVYRNGPKDKGVFRVGYSGQDGVGYPMFVNRFGTMFMDAAAQRITLSFSGQIDQFKMPSPEAGSTPHSLIPEQVRSTGTDGIIEWLEGLNVTVNVTLSRTTGQWCVEDCFVTDDPDAANELRLY